MTAEAMDETAIDRQLRAAGSGVLSLTRDAESYAIPESFGYDGDHLYFQLVYHDRSRKMAFIEATDVAAFTVYTEQPARSVLVRGPLESVPETEELLATSAIAENATIPTLDVSLDYTPDELSSEFYRLVPSGISGRRFGDAADPTSLRQR